MDKQTQAVNIKRRRSRAEIQQLMAEFEASGLGRTAFCQQRGLSLSTLARYRRRQEQTASEVAGGKHWLAVEVAGGAGFFRSAGLERLFRDVQGARYHALRGAAQRRYTGRLALGLDPNE